MLEPVDVTLRVADIEAVPEMLLDSVLDTVCV